ncbi:hypothetical protein JCM6882_004836 [Rhodosporidiobolus microsporus]
MPFTDKPPASSAAAPSLTPSRKRRLSLKSLNPFRRDRRDSDLTPLHPIPLDPIPLDPPPQDETPARPASKASSVFSKKLRRRSLMKLGGGGARAEQKAQEEKENEERRAKEEEHRRSGINWQKRTANQPLPSEAATIRAAWIREQIINAPPPTISVEIDPRASISSVGSLLFPSTAPGQSLGVFTAPPPRSVQQPGGPALDYSTYAPSMASTASRDDIVRAMAKPFPSRPASSQASELRRASLSLTSPTPEEETLPFAFPLPPARQSDMLTPPASPFGSVSPLHKEPSAKAAQPQGVPFDTPPHTPQRLSYHEGSDRRSSPPSRQGSLVIATDYANRDPNGRPLSLTIPPSSSTVPIFTRGTSPFARLSGHQRSASAALPSTTSSSASNSTSTIRRPVSIAPQLGGRRMSASLASSGAFTGVAPGGANRQSWASMQSQASSVGSSTSASQGGRGLIDEIRRRAEEREKRGKSHRRGDSNATVMQEKADGARWQPAEAEILEKENVGVQQHQQPYLGDVEQEVRGFAYEAEEMFSDERMQALVRELGI